MIRAVLDANTLVSGFPASAGTLARLIDHWRANKFRLVISQQIRDEVERAWTKPYWQGRFSQARVAEALALLHSDAELTRLTVEVRAVATHPEDDLVLAAAASARVDYLVTGDRQLQALGAYRGVAIVSPREFVALLDAREHA